MSTLMAQVGNAAHAAKQATGLGLDAKEAQLQHHVVDVHTKGAVSTTDYGVKVSNQDDWLMAGNEDHPGPQMLEDHIAREKINRFDHERIPERVVHARGAGAFGTFTLFESAEDVTMAAVLNDTSRKTPLFTRFSTVLGSRGSADTVRDVHGFAVKMYTAEGNWDIVGNNIPVFFVQDSMKFPDIIHSGKPEPDTEVPQAQTAHNNFWDFAYLHSETTHMQMWAMSDRTIPRSYRMMQGFGVNTFRLINKHGKAHFVKFHWTPDLGVHSLVWDEALKLAGQDPDFHRKDLYEAIENMAYPTWKFGIQVIPEGSEHGFEFDILDATKVWPEELVPIRYIGQMELNRNVEDYFAQTEQVAFCTSHIVPGIDFSDDPLLQGRNFSYLDTQLSRLGVNFQDLPVNRPVCPVINFNRDGQGNHRINKGKVNYWPNRFDAVPPTKPEDGGFSTFPEKVEGMKVRLKSKKFGEHFDQAQLFYNSMSPHEKAHILAAFGFELDHCDDPIVYNRICQRLTDIDLEMAKSVSELVGGPELKTGRANKGMQAKGLSQTDFAPKTPTIATRRVAIIIGEGFDATEYYSMKAALTTAQAMPFTIGTKRAPIQPEGSGKPVMPDHHLEGQRSTMFDAVFIPGGAHIKLLAKNGRAIHWVREAFAHCKAIAGAGTGVGLVELAIAGLPQVQTSGMSRTRNGSGVVESYGVVTGSSLGSAEGEDYEKNPVKIVSGASDFIGKFFYAISQHRNYQRETDGLVEMLAY